MKLGYTWYYKDWNSSDKVFQLNLAERALYRELIDLAFLNDNKTQLNIKVWVRKFNSNKEEITTILNNLQELDLIEIKEDNTIFIPSCESRLNMIRGGKKGGKKGKRTETKTNKEIKYFSVEDYLKDIKLVGAIKKHHNLNDIEFTQLFNNFKLNYLGHQFDEEKFIEVKKHFNNWIKKEKSNTNTKSGIKLDSAPKPLN